MEFPAVSQSRIDFWKEPQFTQSGMWWFTLFFGIFGLHHVLLRSPQTALIFFIVNLFTLGYYWLFDLVQLSTYGGVNLETLNKYGLDHPWGALGLAQGMWIDDNAPEKEPTKGSPPSPWFFLLYALMVPFAVVSNLIAGDLFNAAGRFGLLIFIPFGFLITFFAIFYDSWQMFGTPADLLFSGTKRIFPWTIWMDPDSHSPNLMSKTEVKPCPKESFITAIYKIVYQSFKNMYDFTLGAGMIVAPEFVVPFVAGVDAGERTLDNAIVLGKDAVVGAGEIIETAENVAANTIGTAAELAGKIGHLASSASSLSSSFIPSTLPPIASLASATPPVPAANSAVPEQKGGAKGSFAKNPLDYLAFGSIVALIGGGILLTANRNFRDAASN